MNEPQKQFIDVEGELKPGEGVQIDQDTKYEYGSRLETEGIPLIDPGEGKIVSIRVFDFKMNPALKDFPIDKQLIFNTHAKQISTILWGDGLKPLESNPPRVIIDRKRGSYQIFVPCEARLGVGFVDKPVNLTQELAKQAKRKLDSKKK